MQNHSQTMEFADTFKVQLPVPQLTKTFTVENKRKTMLYTMPENDQPSQQRKNFGLAVDEEL